MKIGVCFGGYAPLHQGHLDVIMRAKKECDKVLLIVCGYVGEPRGQEIGCSLEDKRRRISNFFYGDEIIKVTAINDTVLGLDESMKPENWKIWTNEVKRLSNEYFGEDPTVYYVSEPFYRERLEGLGLKVVLMQRELPISGTMIRKEPLKYWNYIASCFRDCFSHSILITGTASEGKTTLCNDISTYFNIPWFPEYGRKYMEKKGISDDKLTFIDFSEFIKNQTPSEIRNKNKIWISDTDNLVTLMYAKVYSERDEMVFTPEDYKELKKLVKPREWSKIFMLPPKSSIFVDDGIRYMPQSSMEEREKNYEILKELMNEYGYEYEELRGSYYQNFLTVKNYIQTL